jgi:hypothetical protein
MDDDQNLACILRELERRGKPLLVLPPLRTVQGTAAYISVSPGQFAPEVSQSFAPLDTESWPSSMAMEVWDSGDGWMLTALGGDEIGPFDNEVLAHQEARAILARAGALLLKNIPWDEHDLKGFPLYR